MIIKKIGRLFDSIKPKKLTTGQSITTLICGFLTSWVVYLYGGGLGIMGYVVLAICIGITFWGIGALIQNLVGRTKHTPID